MKRTTKLFTPFLLIILISSGCISNPSSATTPTIPSKSPHLSTTSLATNTEVPITIPINTPTPGDEGSPANDDLGFGVEISRLDVDFSKIKSIGAKWVRYNGVLWSDIEPQEGQYQWEKLSQLEDTIKRANDASLHLILIVRSTPTWAQKVPGSFCGPISPGKLGAFATFMAAVAERYKIAPLLVEYWELWNEPDIATELVSGDSVYGCWGDNNDATYGGEYYADMLKTVTPAIRMANPTAKIFLGGLLLDCDPTNPGTAGRCKAGYDLPPKFFEGILKSGGAGSLDYVSFHGYPHYDPKSINPVPAEFNMPSWQARGGVVAGKANFLREVMAKYNVSLPLFLTETSLLCSEKLPDCNPAGPKFFENQAEYAAWLLVRNRAEGIGTIWYTYDGPGWRSSGILDERQNAKPVFTALQSMAALLEGSNSFRKIDEPGVVGYQFSTPKGTFTFRNPLDNHPSILVDQGAETIDIFGNPIPNR
ncbi:MAG: beta-galactosidase [Anaerolineaceae bacterium]|nr:beta-galactosidase [Anaerolineaceae bacterium]